MPLHPSIVLMHSCGPIFLRPQFPCVVSKVSIPAYFHNSQRKAVITSCHIAGLDAKMLVVEPSAASMAHIYYAPMGTAREFSKYFMVCNPSTLFNVDIGN